jgi:hypothetical protein
MSTNEIGFHPGARLTDPETSHEASDAKNHGRSQGEIVQNVAAYGPGTEETILNRMCVPRTSASSEISALVKGGNLVDLIDPRTQKVITLRNISGCRARVRGLPAHQQDTTLIQRLLVQMDTEGEVKAPRRKPPLSTAGAEKARTLSTGIERRSGNDRRKSVKLSGQ